MNPSNWPRTYTVQLAGNPGKDDWKALKLDQFLLHLQNLTLGFCRKICKK